MPALTVVASSYLLVLTLSGGEFTSPPQTQAYQFGTLEDCEQAKPLVIELYKSLAYTEVDARCEPQAQTVTQAQQVKFVL